MFAFSMPSFSKKENAVLGIDITSSAVKLLELSKADNRYKVESYAVSPLPDDVVVDKCLKNVQFVGEVIRKTVKRSGTHLKQAAVAVGGAAVITRLITLPADLNDDEMVEQIIIEADQYIPYSIDEVNFDFKIEGINAENPNLVNVLLAASRKENVTDLVSVLDIAGLKAKVVDIETFAIENSFSLLVNQLPYSVNDKTIVIIEIGAIFTTLHVLHNFRSVYTREQNFGGRQLTEDVQRAYNLNFDEAEIAKKLGGLPENYDRDILEAFKRNIVEQVQRAIQLFIASNAGHSIDSIIIAGGCASITGISSMIFRALNIPTYVANPFINMAISGRVDVKSLDKNASSMLVACGLAQRSFDS